MSDIAIAIGILPIMFGSSRCWNVPGSAAESCLPFPTKERTKSRNTSLSSDVFDPRHADLAVIGRLETQIPFGERQ